VVNEDFFARIGAAAGAWLAKKGQPCGTAIIGRDTRSSGAGLSQALGAGLLSAGARPVLAGIAPTPAVSRAVGLGGAALGAAVTASHNPAGDNGVKFFGPGGSKLSDADEAEIEELIPPAAPPPGAHLPGESILDAYISSAARILPPYSLDGWIIALDTANGATCATSPAVFAALGAALTSLGDRPDGANINREVGSEHPAALAAAVLSAGARLGVAHDGDGDRCVLCDEKGAVLDGDEILAILAVHALSKGLLAEKTLVVTVQSNLGLDHLVEGAGGRVVRTDVGDRYVAEQMRATGAVLGGESSGHIICRDLGPTGDGLAAALKVAAVMLDTGRPLSELRSVLRRFPQATSAIAVRSKPPVESLPVLAAAMRALEADLGRKGRVLVRYSGTEPKLRFLVEGPSGPAVSAGLARLVAAAQSDLKTA
jgi:phosphoglucosamine mutase